MTPWNWFAFFKNSAGTCLLAGDHLTASSLQGIRRGFSYSFVNLLWVWEVKWSNRNVSLPSSRWHEHTLCTKQILAAPRHFWLHSTLLKPKTIHVAAFWLSMCLLYHVSLDSSCLGLWQSEEFVLHQSSPHGYYDPLISLWCYSLWAKILEYSLYFYRYFQFGFFPLFCFSKTVFFCIALTVLELLL